MGSPCLFTRQQALKLGYFYQLRVKNSNPLLTELSLCYLKQTFFTQNIKLFFIQISSIASFNSFLIAWLWAYCTFSDSSVVSLKSSPRPKYETIFPTKSCSTIKLFFFFKYVHYQTVLRKYLRKKSGVTVLVSSQTAAKGGWVLRSQSGWIICAAGTRARYKIKPIVFEVCTRD